ncbi:MAG: glycosyltransferase family 2 protein [Oscillospiraceae bacterium]
MSRLDKPLVSVAITAYHSGDYIYTAIKSVLRQDYPAIELIITDDGSEDFDESSIQEYINNNKKDNLINAIVRTSEHNEGTVKNINHAIDVYSGEFFIMFAADDKLADNEALSKFINAFGQLDTSELIVTAKSKLCNEELSDVGTDAMSNALGLYLNELSAKEQFKQLSYNCIYTSGATMYKRAFFERFGKCEEKYFLIEDLALWLRCTADGVKLNYFGFEALQHRDGGVSHSYENVKVSFAQKKFYEDHTHIYEDYVWPRLHWYNKDEQDVFIRSYTALKLKYHETMQGEAHTMSAVKRAMCNKGRYALMVAKIMHDFSAASWMANDKFLCGSLALAALLLFAKLLIQMPFFTGGVYAVMSVALGFAASALITIGALMLIAKFVLWVIRQCYELTLLK